MSATEELKNATIGAEAELDTALSNLGLALATVQDAKNDFDGVIGAEGAATSLATVEKKLTAQSHGLIAARRELNAVNIAINNVWSTGDKAGILAALATAGHSLDTAVNNTREVSNALVDAEKAVLRQMTVHRSYDHHDVVIGAVHNAVTATDEAADTLLEFVGLQRTAEEKAQRVGTGKRVR